MKVVVWKGVREYLLLTAGALVLALGMDLFLVPFRIAPGHIGGLAIITHHYLGLCVGVFMLLVNVPIFLLGVRYLGGLSFLAPALYTVFLYSLAVDLLAPWLPTNLPQDPPSSHGLRRYSDGGGQGTCLSGQRGHRWPEHPGKAAP